MDCVAFTVISKEMKMNGDNKGNSSRSELRGLGAEVKTLCPHIGEVELVVACSWCRAAETCSGGEWNCSYCDVATQAVCV